MDKFDALSAAIGNEIETPTDPIVIKLQKALCDELLASYQYWTCYQSSRGKGKADCDPEFKAHYEEEKDHAEKLMLRINELGGKPIPHPANWAEVDPTTHRLIKQILSDEEEHLYDLKQLLDDIFDEE